MKIVQGRAEQFRVREWRELPCFDQHYPFRILHFALDQEECFFRDEQTHFLEKVWMNNGIGNAGFVFKANKNESSRGAGTLTANHVAGNLDGRTMARLHEISRAPDIGQSFAQ